MLPPSPFPAGDDLHYRLPAPSTTLAYRVRTLGQTHDNPRHATLGTYFEDAALLVFLSGRGEYTLGDSTQAVTRGMVGLILPGSDPGLLTADTHHPYDHLHCRFAGHEALASALRISQSQRGRRFFRFNRWQEVAQVLRRGVMLWPGREGIKPGAYDTPRRVDAVLAEALACLETQDQPAQRRVNAQALWEYMHAYIDQPIDLQQAAAHFQISKQHLCRVAKQELGSTMGDAWAALKVNWAKALLKRHVMTVNQAAKRVGYEDPLYFSRVFRKHVGQSPRQWRDEVS